MPPTYRILLAKHIIFSKVIRTIRPSFVVRYDEGLSEAWNKHTDDDQPAIRLLDTLVGLVGPPTTKQWLYAACTPLVCVALCLHKCICCVCMLFGVCFFFLSFLFHTNRLYWLTLQSNNIHRYVYAPHVGLHAYIIILWKRLMTYKFDAHTQTYLCVWQEPSYPEREGEKERESDVEIIMNIM